jgi:hypothetical protein
MMNETEEILMVASTCEPAPDSCSGGFVPRRIMRVWWYGQSISTNNAVPHHAHATPVPLAGEHSGRVDGQATAAVEGARVGSERRGHRFF